MSGTNSTFLGFFILFLVMSVLFAWLYTVGVNRPPLVYAHIPDKTRNFIDRLGKNGDQGLTFTDQGPFDWEQENNVGEDGWQKEFDANFIVYYHSDKKAQWQLYAQQVLKQANDNIASLIDLMGRYYYPSDMNGRKLAIYLPETPELYAKTVSMLLEGETGTGSIGITLMEIGQHGCLTKGIVLHPCVFEDAPYGANGFVKVLQHEMNHYVFFSSLDYTKEIEHYLWVSEGVAEYYSERSSRKQITSSESINIIESRCKLNGEFPLTGNASYWAGESFYLYLENKAGIKGVHEFLNNAYVTSTDSVFVKCKMQQKVIHKNWVDYLRSNKNAQNADVTVEEQADAQTDSENIAENSETQTVDGAVADDNQKHNERLKQRRHSGN